MNIAVYCGSNLGNNPKFKETAESLGNWIGENGHTLVYGGGCVGLMGAAADTVLKANGHVIGVCPHFFEPLGVVHKGLSQLIWTDTMSQRKAKMIELSDAFIALPGGSGTLEEISEVISLKKLGKTDAPCILMNIDGFYEPLRALYQTMIHNGFYEPDDLDKIVFAPCLESALSALTENR